MQLTHSGIITIDEKPTVSIRFERENDYAEGIVPAAKITKSEGFSKEEIEDLERYLRENEKDLFQRAKSISGIQNWF